MGFPRQEYQNEFPFFYPGDLPDPGIKPMSLALAGRFLTTEPLGKKDCWVHIGSFKFGRTVTQ